MQFHRVRRITSAHAALSVHTHNSTPNRASMISSSGRPVRLGPESHASAWNSRVDRFRSCIAAPPEWSEGMSPSRTCLALLLSLMLLAGLAGCGPTSSDNAPNLESRASVGGPPLSKQGPSPRNDPFTSVTPEASPVPLASGNETGVASGKGTVTGGDSLLAVSASSTKPADTLDPLVVPTWMGKELDSPDVGSRSHTLETWAQSVLPRGIDP